MEIKNNKKGVVIDFQGNKLVSKGKYGVRITGDSDIPLTVKNAIFHNDKAYPIGMPIKISKINIVCSVAVYISLKILEGE